MIAYVCMYVCYNGSIWYSSCSVSATGSNDSMHVYVYERYVCMYEM